MADEIIRSLAEIAEYIRGCERNAAPGSKAQAQFAAWLKTISTAQARIMGEDET